MSELITYDMLPNELHLSLDDFTTLWEMIPDEFNYIHMYGKLIQTPRKYKVYGQPYNFPGMSVEIVEPIPSILQPYLDYINTLDGYTYNSVLINWYEGDHYIGFHADTTTHLVRGSNIYGISFGEKRTMRFKAKDGNNLDYLLQNNSIINMHNGCQEVYKHSILKSKKLVNRRINITFRAVDV
jgi:alkylated DNA repair dioxygenase AlkB